MTRYLLSMQAVRDIDTLLAYYEENSERAARRLELELVSEFVSLATLPAQYRHEPSIMPSPARVRSFRDLLIWYDGETRPITILRVVHGSRDLSTLRQEFSLE